MDLQQRVVLLEKLGHYILSDDEKWALAKAKAEYENAWFIPEFVDYQLKHIGSQYLSTAALQNWVADYNIPNKTNAQKRVGLVMAGNIPLAGFHDFLSTFVSGRYQAIKPSSKDAVLIAAIIEAIKDWAPESEPYFTIASQLRGCDAYIATGSNNSSRYFEYYFSKYPHIIRRNRTSVAILTGNETLSDLSLLADDVYLYFGLGCRNVTKIYVPPHYDFLPLLESFKKYTYLADHNKFRNNYDYQLAVLQINRRYYMTNGSMILQENSSLFSPISQLHFEYTDNPEKAGRALLESPDVQCVVGKGFVPFGKAQQPAVDDYADQADTLKFLREL